METEDQKPKAKPYSAKSRCLAWLCYGYKGGKYHCAFGEDFVEASKKWHATDPIITPPVPGDGFTDDIPF